MAVWLTARGRTLIQSDFGTIYSYLIIFDWVRREYATERYDHLAWDELSRLRQPSVRISKSPCWARVGFATGIRKASNRQFHAKLLALAAAEHRQVYEFASLDLFDRFSKIGDITGPLSVNRDDQLV